MKVQAPPPHTHPWPRWPYPSLTYSKIKGNFNPLKKGEKEGTGAEIGLGSIVLNEEGQFDNISFAFVFINDPYVPCF